MKVICTATKEIYLVAYRWRTIKKKKTADKEKKEKI